MRRRFSFISSPEQRKVVEKRRTLHDAIDIKVSHCAVLLISRETNRIKAIRTGDVVHLLRQNGERNRICQLFKKMN